jgi:membrane protease YdiL (CAAX protease family)
MQEVHMNRRELLWIPLLLVVGLAGLWTFLHYYREAFPAASLDFKLSREEVFESAEQYVEGLGYDTKEYGSAQIFSSSAMQQIFMEQTVGLEETNRLALDWLSIWTWNVRWYKPLQKEEFSVGLDPGGRVVRFSHNILESDEGSSLEQDKALTIAQGFLEKHQQFDLAGYELIERTSKERKARIDHTFTYRRNGFTVGDDGHYRLEVVVQGDRVGRFREYLKVPETFSREYREVRSRANFLTSVFTVFWLALVVAMLVVLIKAFKTQVLQWRTGMIVGILVAVATVVGALNSIPLVSFNFDTTSSASAFLLMFLVSSLLGAVTLGGVICLAGVAGGTMGGQVLNSGRRDPLGRFSLKGLLSADFLRSTAVGYGIAGVMLGYVTIFYLVGSRYFGVWAPADVSDYDNAFSTVIPWIYPLLMGLTAATMEEFFFRLLAITLLLKWLKRPWLAVLLPAIVWGFLHSNYPIEPIYTRGIELTVVGVMFGIAFLRYGIWAPIIAHYAFNAFLTALPMMKSTSAYFQVSGILVTGILLLPAIPALIAVITGKGQEEAEEPEPNPVPTPEPRAEEVFPDALEPSPESTPVVENNPSDYELDGRKWTLVAVFGVLGIALTWGFQVDRFASSLSVSVSRDEAVASATTFCGEMGLDVSSYSRSVQFQNRSGSSHFTHLVRKAGVARAESLAIEETKPWRWQVRWFKDLQKEEIRVSVGAAGGIVGYTHMIPEGQEGDALEVGKARALAEEVITNYLNSEVTDSTQYKVLEERSEKEEARMDHHFVWERIDRKVEDGEFRITSRVQGSEVGAFGLYYKAPEKFLRDLRKRGPKEAAAGLLPVLFGLATVVFAGIYFFRSYAAGDMSWGFPIRVGILVAAVQLIDSINTSVTFFHGYDTSQAMWTFLGMRGIGLLTGIAGAGFMAMVLIALGNTLLKAICPQEMGLDRWGGLLRFAEGSPRFWLHTLAMAGSFFLLKLGMQNLNLFVKYEWLADHLKPTGYNLSRLNTYLPSLDALVDGIMVFMGPLLILVILLVWKRVVSRPWIIVAGLIIITLTIRVIQPAQGLGHFATLAGMELFYMGMQLAMVVLVIRFNLMAYFISAWASRLILGPGLGMLERTDIGFYQANSVVILVLGFAPLLFPLIAKWRQGGERTDLPAG